MNYCNEIARPEVSSVQFLPEQLEKPEDNS
jgi:hypothetical protein